MLIISVGYIWPSALIYVQVLLTLVMLVLSIRLLYEVFMDLFED